MIQDINLKLGGKKRFFTFGIVYLGNVLEILDVDYGEMLNKVAKNPFKYAPLLMFESLKNTYIKEKKEIDFTESDIIAWLEVEELMGVNLMLSFINAFMGTQENKTPLDVEAVEDTNTVKKK